MATILIVDDEPGFRQILNIIIKRAGHTPLLATDADEAEAIVRAHQPDLLILDDNMPEREGSALCRDLKLDPTTAHIPIIMYTANNRFDNPNFAQQIGADAVVKKPSMPADLLAAVQRCLEARAGV
jgi:CheY-like chemotaxis protein